MSFRLDSLDRTQLIRFSFNQLCQRYASSNGGRYSRAIKKTLSDLTRSFIRITNIETCIAHNLLRLLQAEAPEFRRIAHVVGQWVWIQFRQKQPPTVTSALAQFGFHWNKRRQLWQHPCGIFVSRGADYDPRRRYGSRIPQAA